MLRVAAWTVGLFGAGAAVSRMFRSPWVEPVVLLALGMAFLFVSRRAGRAPAPAVAKLPARARPAAAPGAAAAAASAPAAVPVEQSA